MIKSFWNYTDLSDIYSYNIYILEIKQIYKSFQLTTAVIIIQIQIHCEMCTYSIAFPRPGLTFAASPVCRQPLQAIRKFFAHSASCAGLYCGYLVCPYRWSTATRRLQNWFLLSLSLCVQKWFLRQICSVLRDGLTKLELSGERNGSNSDRCIFKFENLH